MSALAAAWSCRCNTGKHAQWTLLRIYSIVVLLLAFFVQLCIGFMRLGPSGVHLSRSGDRQSTDSAKWCTVIDALDGRCNSTAYIREIDSRINVHQDLSYAVPTTSSIVKAPLEIQPAAAEYAGYSVSAVSIWLGSGLLGIVGALGPCSMVFSTVASRSAQVQRIASHVMIVVVAGVVLRVLSISGGDGYFIAPLDAFRTSVFVFDDPSWQSKDVYFYVPYRQILEGVSTRFSISMLVWALAGETSVVLPTIQFAAVSAIMFTQVFTSIEQTRASIIVSKLLGLYELLHKSAVPSAACILPLASEFMDRQDVNLWRSQLPHGIEPLRHYAGWQVHDVRAIYQAEDEYKFPAALASTLATYVLAGVTMLFLIARVGDRHVYTGEDRSCIDERCHASLVRQCYRDGCLFGWQYLAKGCCSSGSGEASNAASYPKGAVVGILRRMRVGARGSDMHLSRMNLVSAGSIGSSLTESASDASSGYDEPRQQESVAMSQKPSKWDSMGQADPWIASSEYAGYTKHAGSALPHSPQVIAVKQIVEAKVRTFIGLKVLLLAWAIIESTYYFSIGPMHISCPEHARNAMLSAVVAGRVLDRATPAEIEGLVASLQNETMLYMWSLDVQAVTGDEGALTFERQALTARGFVQLAVLLWSLAVDNEASNGSIMDRETRNVEQKIGILAVLECAACLVQLITLTVVLSFAVRVAHLRLGVDGAEAKRRDLSNVLRLMLHDTLSPLNAASMSIEAAEDAARDVLRARANSATRSAAASAHAKSALALPRELRSHIHSLKDELAPTMMQSAESIVAVLRDTVSLEESSGDAVKLRHRPCDASRMLLTTAVGSFRTVAGVNRVSLEGWTDQDTQSSELHRRESSGPMQRHGAASQRALASPSKTQPADTTMPRNEQEYSTPVRSAQKQAPWESDYSRGAAAIENSLAGHSDDGRFGSPHRPKYLCDLPRLQQCTANFISNAVKFSLRAYGSQGSEASGDDCQPMLRAAESGRLRAVSAASCASDAVTATRSPSDPSAIPECYIVIGTSDTPPVMWDADVARETGVLSRRRAAELKSMMFALGSAPFAHSDLISGSYIGFVQRTNTRAAGSISSILPRAVYSPELPARSLSSTYSENRRRTASWHVPREAILQKVRRDLEESASPQTRGHVRELVDIWMGLQGSDRSGSRGTIRSQASGRSFVGSSLRSNRVMRLGYGSFDGKFLDSQSSLRSRGRGLSAEDEEGGIAPEGNGRSATAKVFDDTRFFDLASERGQTGDGLPLDFPVAMLSFWVWDRGVGIADHNRRQLFRQFSQINANLQQGGKGSGLGLAITENIVKLHGGACGCISEEGTGSIFWAWVPCPLVMARRGSELLAQPQLSGSLVLPSRSQRPKKSSFLVGSSGTAIMRKPRRPRRRDASRKGHYNQRRDASTRDSAGAGGSRSGIPRLPSRVLCVDDERSNRKYIASAVRRIGVTHVLEAADGARALELLGVPGPLIAAALCYDDLPSRDEVAVMEQQATAGLDDESREVYTGASRGASRSRQQLSLEMRADSASSSTSMRGKPGLLATSHEGYAAGQGSPTARALGPGDVILMDFSMPRVGGAECARAIRRDAALDGVRIIGVTGNVLLEDQRHFVKCGAERVLPKPVRRQVLADALMYVS